MGDQRNKRAGAIAVGILAAAGWLHGAAAGQAVVPGPNGQIAFESSRDGTPDIFVMNSDGTIERNITRNGATDVYPVWSPDGTKILFASDRAEPGNLDVWRMKADGSDPVRLTTTPGEDRGASYTSDGAKIVFHSQRFRDAAHAFDLMTMNADGSNQQLLVANGSAGYVCGTSTTGVVVFNSAGNPLGTNPEGDFEIFSIRIDGTGLRQLTSNSVLDSGPKWSPDCASVSYNSLDAGGSLDVHRMNADGSGDTDLTNTPGVFDAFSAFSPDGQRIVFTSERGGNYEIYTMDAAGGGNVVQYTEAKQGDLHLRADWGTAADYDGPPTDKDQCRKDRWTEFSNPTFADQAQCVSYVVSGSISEN